MLSDRRRYEPPGSPGGPGGGREVTGLADLGDPCTDALDCKSAFCLDIANDGLVPFCSSRCVPGGCPSGMTCRATADGLEVCGFDAPPAGGELGAACRFGLECLSGLCLDLAGDAQGKFCSRACDARACPLGMICVQLDDGRRVCAAEPPAGEGGVGQTCRSAIDCRTGLCIDVDSDSYGPYCSAACASDGDCPTDMGCLAGQDGVLRCIFRSGSQPIGAFCRSDAECASGICIDVHGDAAAAYCTDSCRGAIDCPGNMACGDLPGLGPSCIY
jgi:hypothetical protein